MYFIYLYCDDKYRRSISVQYGYWSGHTCVCGETIIPGTADDSNGIERKNYKSLNRAIKGGYKAIEKYTYCCGFDVEDENGNIVYKSFDTKSENYSNNNGLDNEVLTSNNKVDTPILDKMLEIQEQSELCEDFLEWFLQKYIVFEKDKNRELQFVDVNGPSDYINVEKLLAEYFEIDLKEAERERQSILTSL